MSLYPYEAPMYNCDSPDVVKGSYFVFLHKGCTLKQHKRAIGITFESKIVFESRENYRFGPLYCVRGIRNVDLQKIRADIAVDLVKCDRLIPDDPMNGVARDIYPDGMFPYEQALKTTMAQVSYASTRCWDDHATISVQADKKRWGPAR